MWFLIRAVFWLSLLLLFLPLGGQSGEEGEETVGALQTLFAAREAVHDMAGLCERQPQVCATGQAVLTTIGIRAREGVRLVSEMLEDEEMDKDKAGPEEPAVTGSIPAEE